MKIGRLDAHSLPKLRDSHSFNSPKTPQPQNLTGDLDNSLELGVSNGSCEHLRACEHCVLFCEHEQRSANLSCEQGAL